ncbi:MAG: hypothetical protein JXA10_18135 [Anaerolineae bacterium]|nr:hypothetical protein [Anaerolineae bacterium]
MTFQGINYGRVFQAIMFIVGTTLALYLLLALLAMFFVSEDMIQRLQDVSTEYTDYISSSETDSARQAEIEDDLRAVVEDYQGEISGLFALLCGGALVLLGIVFWFSRRAAREATSRAQANGYGLIIGVGVSVVLATICGLINPASLFASIFFFVFVVLAALIGGWQGGQRLKSAAVYGGMPGGPAISSMPPGMISAPPGGDATLYYNMGVTAAMGGRREEARQHFGRVLQYEPRNVAAWLQLANLADTPVHAWEYIEQARAINPSDPSVVQAVNMIWPQVKDQVAARPIQSQPPYRGGTMDDTDIPRTRLPDLNEPGDIVPPRDPDADDDLSL